MGLFDFLFRKKYNRQYENIESIKEIDKHRNVIYQQMEDAKIERGIREEAMRWIREDSTRNVLSMRLMNPFIHCKMIYDEETSKYKNANIQQLVCEEYERLKLELAKL